MITLGKLEQIAVRSAWPGEASDFTPWLAAEENLAFLATALCMEALELVEIESGVGPYRADILARHEGSDEMVVIENQFGKSDHNHLGQLMTYAAGVGSDGSGAKTIVWIAEEFTEPHRAALDWLNKCTEPGIRFYGVELQLWRIGDSAPAPRFSMISRPNDWQKRLTQAANAPTEANKLYLEFWANFISYCEKEGSSLKMPSSPPDRHWLSMAVGRTGFSVNVNARKKSKDVECHLWIDGKDAGTQFAALLDRKAAIVAALGPNTRFDNEAPSRCKIFETRSLDVTNRDAWPDIDQWLRERAEAYVNYFTPLVAQL